MIKQNQKYNAEKGSVLMEFVLVLPIYIVAIGGILWIGFKSLDTINLRVADHWGVWISGLRFGMRTPALLALQDMFPRASAIYKSDQRSLVDKNSFLQFIGAKTKIMESRPDFLSNWINMSYSTRGEKDPQLIPEFFMTSSRYNNTYTQCIIMRTKHSLESKRHWDASILANENIWDFDSKEDQYPKEWKIDLLNSPKYTNDEQKQKNEPKKIEFYERFDKYKEWSKPN